MKRKTNAGFTLIELMIVVAIIGVLAVLAIFGVSKYLKNAKTAEATNSLGSINQDAVQAYNKESTQSGVAVGAATGSSRSLCPSSAAAIPAAPPANAKYTAPPNGVGSYLADPGFACLGFSMSQPQYFAYDYINGGASKIAPDAKVTGLTGWGTGASADFNGTGQLVEFATGGNIVNGEPITATAIASYDQSTGQAF
ncbi:MAG TPA: type II secretion system protein [Polyangiaceae bacterium]